MFIASKSRPDTAWAARIRILSYERKHCESGTLIKLSRLLAADTKKQPPAVLYLTNQSSDRIAFKVCCPCLLASITLVLLRSPPVCGNTCCTTSWLWRAWLVGDMIVSPPGSLRVQEGVGVCCLHAASTSWHVKHAK